MSNDSEQDKATPNAAPQANSKPKPKSKPMSAKPAARKKARRFAVQALYQWQMTGANLTDIEAQFHAENDFKKTDTEYFHMLLHGVPTNVNEVDEGFEKYLDRDKKDLDQVELAILRVGIYELLTRLDVPYRVVINEGIELAKTFGATESHKYVNGILDKASQALRMVEVRAHREKNKPKT